MTAAKTTACAICLLAIWPRSASADEPAPRLIAAVPTAASAAPLGVPTAAPAGGDDEGRPVGETHHVVLFAGRTVEFAVPRAWTVKQVPLSGEIRVLAGPGDVPAEPHRLERGIWIAYHRSDAQPDVSLDTELRERLPKGVAVEFLPSGAPQALRVGGYAALKQHLELAAVRDDAMPRRATYVITRTPWGLLEALGVTGLYAGDDVRPALKTALASLRFNPPAALRPASAPGIADAQAALGSWKGQQLSLHLLPEGRVRLDFDAVTTLTMEREGNTPSRNAGKQIEGTFTAHGDILFITWDDGSKLNYRWRVQANELLLMDHTGQSSRMMRLFDSPPSAGQATPATANAAGGAQHE